MINIEGTSSEHKEISCRKILLISWTTPPIMGSHGKRVANFIKYLDKFGWKVDVLTVLSNNAFPNYDEDSLNLLPSRARIFRVKSGIFSHIYYDVKGKSSNNARSDFSFFFRFLRIPVSMIWKIFSKLDLFCLFDWTPYAIVHAVKLARKNNYDILLSSGMSNPHKIAFFAFAANNSCKWILDYGDPWVFDPTYKDEHNNLRFKIDHWLEEKFLKAANAITVTTEETKNLYLKEYPFLDDTKIKVIPMGINYNDFIGVVPEKSKKFRILYTGTIYATRGNIKPFLDAITRLCVSNMRNDFEVIFAGDIGDKYKELVRNMGLNNIITFCGFVPYKKVLSLMAGADLLISFGNEGRLQIPGKLFDYLGSKKPILWILGDEMDPALRYIRDLSNVIIVCNECKDIYLKLSLIFELYRTNQLKDRFSSRNELDMSWENRVNILDEVCREIIDQ